MDAYHLDTDYLIAFVEPYHDSHQRACKEVKEWLVGGRSMAASACAWTEFYAGKPNGRPPLEVEQARGMLCSRIIPYTVEEAEKAAELFNQTGRLTPLKKDCDIAATAIVAGAELATFNLRDFARFVPFGLRIVGFIPLKNGLINQQDISHIAKRHSR